MTRRRHLLAAAVALAAPAAAQQVLPAQSEISFVSRQLGVPVEARFRQWTAQIAFDPRKAAAGRIGLSIQTGSASFGLGATDAEVTKALWFNVAKFPQATFASTRITPLGAGRFEVHGKLTLKGTMQDLVVPVTVSQAGPISTAISTASGHFTIRRLDFRIGDGDWADTTLVGNEVVVNFRFALSGMAPL